MLELPQEFLNKIASMPTEHTWVAKLMAFQSPERTDKEVDIVDDWIEKTIQAEHPESEYAERIVRMMWAAVMEREALEMFAEAEPYIAYQTLTVPWDEEMAAYIAAREIMIPPECEDVEIAVEFLKDMRDGRRIPPSVMKYIEPDDTFYEYQRLILGETGTLFQETETLSREEAIERVFGIKSNKKK